MIKIEEKTKQKQSGKGVGDAMQITWNVGSINDEKKACGEMKNVAARCNGSEAGRVDCYNTRGLKSSSSLRVVAIQAIDIFIRGCYL